MKRLLISFLMLALVAAPAIAAEPRNLAARSSTGATMDNEFTAWIIPTGFGYGGWGWGAGVRYQKVVVPEGFLKSTSGIHDELGIEGGVDFIHARWDAGIYYDYYGNAYSYSWSYNEITPVIGAAWNVWLNQNFALYPKLDFGFRIGSWSDNLGYSVATPSGYGGPLVEGAVGMIVKLDRLALRAEIGNYALRLGAGFNF